jgi:hypothetical protein
MATQVHADGERCKGGQDRRDRADHRAGWASGTLER